MKRYCIIQRLVLLRGSKFILDQFHRNAQEEFGKILYWLKQDFYRPQMEVDIRNLLGNVMFVRKQGADNISSRITVSLTYSYRGIE